MTQFLKALKFIFLIGAGLFFVAFLICELLTIVDLIQQYKNLSFSDLNFEYTCYFLLIITYTLNGQSIPLLQVILFISASVSLFLCESYIKKDRLNGTESMSIACQRKIATTVQIALFICALFFVLYFLFSFVSALGYNIIYYFNTIRHILQYDRIYLNQFIINCFISFFRLTLIFCSTILLFVIALFIKKSNKTPEEIKQQKIDALKKKQEKLQKKLANLETNEQTEEKAE